MSAADRRRVVLMLFVSGASDRSARAVTLARGLCEEHLAGRYELTVVDVRDDPAAVARHEVLAVPTLLRVQPEPVARIVGDLGHTDRVLAMLTDVPGLAVPSPGAP